MILIYGTLLGIVSLTTTTNDLLGSFHLHRKTKNLKKMPRATYSTTTRYQRHATNDHKACSSDLLSFPTVQGHLL